MKLDDQKKTEKELRKIKSTFEQNEDLSYKVFEQMPIGICITDPEGYFTDVNATYCDIYGYTRKELIGKPFLMVVPDESKNELERLHTEFLQKEYELQGKWWVQNKSNERFEIITNAAFIHDQKTKEKRKMTLVVKASELQITIDRLQTTIDVLEKKLEAQDIANRLAEHDMRNRIGSMVSIANILSSSELNDQQKKWVNMLKTIGNDTLNLLTAAKDYARMERGDFTPDLVEFDIISLIANETKDLKESIRLKDIEINMLLEEKEVIPEEDELMVTADKFYVQHLFQNLLGNAIEASPEKGIITITLLNEKDFSVNIHNLGMIPKNIQPRFFEKYSTSGKEGGTGLGTYIAKMIAEVHGGTISFISNETDGTTLRISLPQQSPPTAKLES